MHWSNEVNESESNDTQFTPCWHKQTRYDSVHLTCSKKLTASRLCLPHGTNEKCKRKTENKLMSMISPVQSHYLERSLMSKEEKLRWEGFVVKVGFEPRVKE